MLRALQYTRPSIMLVTRNSILLGFRAQRSAVITSDYLVEISDSAVYAEYISGLLSYVLCIIK